MVGAVQLEFCTALVIGRELLEGSLKVFEYKLMGI